MSRPLSVASTGILQQQSLSLPKQPLAELLLSNLRLLDLDLRADWPDITVKTFATKETQQNQKQRIKCTEWILFRLFELWDPEETRDKLQPFFPPLEPLQSLNLRGALFRALNELKKNGVFGRESVLRKTMLDECKGDKLMELLVIFSNLVLRRADAARNLVQNRSVAHRLATAPMLDAAQQGSLIPLAVAHTASLSKLLREKQEQKQRLAHIDQLLDSKRTQLRERVKTSVQTKRCKSNVAGESQIRKVVQDSWSGSSRWAQAVLNGDEAGAGDLPLQKPFDDVWAVVSRGGSLANEAGNLGLLASLERRVQLQQERLQMWKEFHENLAGPGFEHTKTSTNSVAVSHQFEFRQHQDIQLGYNVATNQDGETRSISKPFAGIMQDFRLGVEAASKSRKEGGTGWSSKADSGQVFQGHDLFSPVKSGAPVIAQIGAPQEVAKKTDIVKDRPQLFPTIRKEEREIWGQSKNEQVVHMQTRTANETKAAKPSNGTLSKPNGHASREVSSAAHHSPSQSEIDQDTKTDEESTLRELPMATPVKTNSIGLPSIEDEEETAADRIISAMLNATPSPAKGMSLTERTRMSMAFAHPPAAPDSIDSGIAMPSPPDSSLTFDQREHSKQGHVQQRVSLLERTRLSMAQASAFPPQPLRSKKIRKSSRQSLFPVNQFETPGKPRQLPEPRRDATPTEKLFTEEAEYDSVFKSRPRIAMSPVWSPDPDDSMALEEGAEEDGDEIDGHREAYGTSPLAGARRKVMS